MSLEQRLQDVAEGVADGYVITMRRSYIELNGYRVVPIAFELPRTVSDATLESQFLALCENLAQKVESPAKVLVWRTEPWIRPKSGPTPERVYARLNYMPGQEPAVALL